MRADNAKGASASFVVALEGCCAGTLQACDRGAPAQVMRAKAQEQQREASCGGGEMGACSEMGWRRGFSWRLCRR
jgi:hypothetical protein